MNGSRAVAYLRRSRTDENRPGFVSWETQLDAVRALAAANGDALPDDTILGERDWGRSGRGSKTHLRPDYARLREMIAADAVSAIYSYNLSRLARSVQEVLSLADVCREHGVAIRLAKDIDPDTTTASGRMLLGILAVVAQWQAETASESASEAVRVRLDAGMRQGRLPYGSRPGEDPTVVRDAFLRAGSYSGAAKVLNERGVPTSATTRNHRRATQRDRLWHASAVSWIVQHQFPDDAPPSPERGVRSKSHARLGRLLICWCRRRLTSTQPARGRMTYRCDRGPIDPEHPRPYVVSESQVIEWVKDEVARLHLPDDRVEIGEQDAGKRADLERRRANVNDMRERGGITVEDWQRRLATIEDELARLDERTRLVAIPSIDWDWPPEQLNGVLRAILAGIQLGPDLRPVENGAQWLVPEWRSDAN